MFDCLVLFHMGNLINIQHMILIRWWSLMVFSGYVVKQNIKTFKNSPSQNNFEFVALSLTQTNNDDCENRVGEDDSGITSPLHLEEHPLGSEYESLTQEHMYNNEHVSTQGMHMFVDQSLSSHMDSFNHGNANNHSSSTSNNNSNKIQNPLDDLSYTDTEIPDMDWHYSHV